MIKHILVPMDLTDRSEVALRKAVELGHESDPKITLVNIHKEFLGKDEMDMLRVSVTDMLEKFRKIARESREEMKATIERLAGEDLEIEYLIREGKPAETIPLIARDLGVDMIIMATDGRDNLRNLVLGTITEKVINHAPCPVLVIPYHLHR